MEHTRDDVRQLHYESLRDRQYVSLQNLTLPTNSHLVPSLKMNEIMIVLFKTLNSCFSLSEFHRSLRNTTRISWSLTLIGSHSSTSRRVLCQSDFIAPLTSGVRDYIGLFTVTTGFGYHHLVSVFFFQKY